MPLTDLAAVLGRVMALSAMTPADIGAAMGYKPDPQISAKVRADAIDGMTAGNPASRQALENAFANDAVLQEFERLVAAHGYSSHNIADAIAAELWTSWQYVHGVTLTDAQIRGIHQQVRVAVLAIPELRSTSNVTRQRIAEAMAYLVVVRGVAMQNASDPVRLAAQRQTTASTAKTMVGVDLSELEVTANSGFSRKQAGAAISTVDLEQAGAAAGAATSAAIRAALNGQSSAPEADLAGCRDNSKDVARRLDACKRAAQHDPAVKAAQEKLNAAMTAVMSAAVGQSSAATASPAAPAQPASPAVTPSASAQSSQPSADLAEKNGAGQQQWQSLNARVLEALKAGNFTEGATKLAEEALSVARKAFGDRAPQTLASLNNLAALYQFQGRNGEAEPLFREVLQVERTVLGPRNPSTLTGLNNLAVLYQNEGRYGEAEPLFREALQARREALGARHADTLQSLNNLADLYQKQGRYGDAEPLFREALQASRAVLGARHPSTLTVLNNLAVLYQDRGRYSEAEPLFREALQARREVLGARHADTLTSLNNLAVFYQKQGRYGEAEPLYREALQTMREVLGGRHPNTLAGLNNLASLYHSQGRYGEAELLYREALQARREALGARHPETLKSLSNVAGIYYDQGRYKDAEPLFSEALQGMREVLGPRHEDTLTGLNNLAVVYRDQGRYGEAEPLFREALQARREALGARHPNTLQSLNYLALLYDRQGRYDEAEPLLREALQTRREVLGASHPDTLMSLNNLASLYQDQKRYGEAEPLHREALRARRETLGARHPDTLMSLNNLAVLYHSQGRYGEAEPLYGEALQARREALGARHPDTLMSLNNLAVLYDALGRYSEAEPLYREALQASREVLGPHHPDALAYQRNMALNLVGQDKRAEAVRLLQQMEPNLLGWIGQELYSTEAGATRRQIVSSQATFQDVVLTLATAAGASGDARRLAGTTMFRFKALQGEEEAYLARLARRSQDPQVQALVDDIGQLRAALAAAAQGGTDAFEKTLQELEGKQRELIAISPEYNDRLRVLAAGLDEVRKALPAGSALIEFRQFRPVIDFRTGKRGEPRFAALLLTGAGEPVVADLGPVSELQPLAAALGASARGAAAPGRVAAPTVVASASGRGLAPDPQGQPLTPADEAAAQLYVRLVAPFKDALAAAKTVYVAPDGILNLAPFARLKLADGRYWFERQEVHMLQTGRDLLRPGADHPARGLLALGGIDFDAGAAGEHGANGTGARDSVYFAAAGSDQKAAVSRAAGVFRGGFPRLPATASEAKDVTALFKKRYADEPAELWSGADASKARLMALKSPPRVLHLATHGFYLPNQSREPMLLSGVALSGANREVAGAGNDGLLFALEAEGLNLDGTELVVLSACDTAKGDVDYSEGVFGLARALRTAGARNVLVTLWPLDDLLARDFMADFYKNWTGQSRSDPAKALRETQLQWIRQDVRRNPQAWAPYVLIE
jgi:tetratricopeptide (TPR) repeat protein/CHAT domain-containing protein